MKYTIKHTLTVLCLLLAAAVHAQTIERKVINTMGGTLAPSGGPQLTHNVGETFSTTLVAGGYSLTQGFLQYAPVSVPPITGTLTVCVGATTALSDSMSGGTWSSTNTSVATVGSTGVVSGVAAGTSTISYTVSGSSVTAVVTVNPLPNAGTITGASSVCAGSTITLSNTTTGGTWSSSNTAIATVGTAGVVTGVAGGTVTISYTVTNSCGISSSTIVVNVSSSSTESGTFSQSWSTILNNSTGSIDQLFGFSYPSGSCSDYNANYSYFRTPPLALNRSGNQVAIVGISNCQVITGAINTSTGNMDFQDFHTFSPANIGATLSYGKGNNLFVQGLNVIGGGSSSTAFLNKFSATGERIFTKTFSEYTRNYLEMLRIDTFNRLLSFGQTWNASTNNNNTIYCHNDSGVFQWSSTISDYDWHYGYPGAIAVDNNNNVFMTGKFQTTSSPSTYQIVIRKLSPIGSTLWQIYYSSYPQVYIGDIITDGNGDVYFTLTSNFTGQTRLVKLNGNTGAVISDVYVDSGYGGTLKVGENGKIILMYGNSAITKLRCYNPSTNAFDWTKIFNGLSCQSFSLDVNNNIYLVGADSIFQISNEGTLLYSNKVTIPEKNVKLRWVECDASGNNFYIVGEASSASYNKIFVTKFSNTGIVSPITGSSSVCTGSSIALSNATTGGSWSSSNTSVATVGSTGVVTGVASGTATISYTVTNACGSGVATKVVTVNPAIGAGTITGASTVNTGSTITLANSTAGGSWSSSNTAIATVGSTGIVTGVAPGTVTISYTVSNACGSASASKVVTVNAAIGDITGTLALCVGSTTSLSNSVSGGLWSSSDGTIATINAYTGLVSGNSSGTATISYSVSGSLATTVVTVLPTPTSITGSSSLCIAATTTLSSAIAGGSWSSSHPAIGSISGSGTLTGLSAGTTLISYTLASGCYATRTITVHPYPSAISGTLVVCQGGTTTLTSSPAGGTWSSSNTRATVSSSGVVTGVTAGTADITYTSPLGCMVKRQLTILATPAAISGHNTLCRYETTELTTESTGGSWSSSNTVVATIDEDGIVASLTTGTTLISYTLSGGCAATFGLTVNAAPAAITGSSTTCAGASVVLSTMTGGGTWSISDTAIATVGSSGIVTGISAGVATVSYTLSNGCYTTTLVTINTLPAAITGLDAVCVGSTTTYTSTTTGGSWSINMPTQATISSSGSLTALTAGNPVLTYTLSSGCRTTKSITINGLPSAITGTLTLCQSATTTLGCLPSGGSWVSGNTAIATIDTSGVLSAIATGTVSITYTTAAGCSRVAVATVTPAPTALSGSLSVCTGTTQLLSSSPSGGSWSTSNTSVATVSGGTVSGISAGTAHITYALSGGCRATATVTVSTSPAAISGTAALCQGSTTTLSNTTSGGSWSSSHTGIASIGSTGIVDGLAAGTTTVSYTLSSGCARTVIVTIHALPSAFSGSLLLCGGSSSSLSSTPTGGSWSSSHTAIATVNMYGTVSAVAAGTSAISYTLATGCRRIGIVTVSVSPSAISGTASICVGQSTALTASPSGGSWSSANAAIVSIGSTGIATGIATGTAAISYTAASGCSSIRIVTVNNSPTAITGTGTVCVGATTALSSGPSGGTWRSSASARATVSSAGIVTGVAAGTATISYNMAGGCRATTIVTVLARPAAVSGAASLCAASVTTMSTTATGGTWSTSNTALATIGSTGILTGVSQGTVIVSYTFSTGCASTRSVVVNASPSAFSGSSSVCRGSSVSFTSSPGGGTWSSSSAATGTIGTTSGSFVGLSAGTTNITYRLSTGCSRVQTVTVNPSPDTLIGNRAICLGTTSTFTASPSGGSWSSSNTAVATISSSTGLANGLSAGTTVITYTASGGCYLTAIVTVNTSFASVIPTVNVCQGSTATLTPPVAGGVWSSTNTARATIDAGSGLVSGLSLGTVLISYTLGGGCAYTTIVNVSTTPATLYGATDVCTGRTATWVSTASGGSWSSSNPSIANINAASGLLTGVSVGTATISYTIVGCVRTRPVTVNVSPAVITGPGTVVLGSSITLSNATAGGVWSSSNAARASVIPATGVVTGMSAGAATITYSDATNGCYQTKPVTVTVSRPGASTAEAVQAFRLHPNPTSGILYASASQSGILTLYTLEGKEIGSYPVGTAEVQIDLAKELSSGMYIGRFIGSNGYTETLRIIYTR